MARAYFDQNPFGAAPIEQGLDTIRRTYSQKAPSPMDNLSKAIQQPFVENVIIPGISRIRDEMRLSEQEEQISAQAQERRDAARSAMGKAFFREAQAKMPEVPTMPSLASLSGSAVVDDQQIGNMSRELEDMVAQGSPSSALRQHVAYMDQFGLGGVAREILQGATAQESLRAAQVAKLKSQLRQQIAAPAPEAVAGPQMLQPSMKGERLLLKNEGQYENPLQRKVDLLARRAYERTEGSREQKMAAATAAAQAAQPEAIAAQEVQAVERPELLEEAAAFRQQATALEAEAKGIEETPVYRTFGDHAMPFLDALDSGDVAMQMALMESVGGSTDYQPFGKGAMGKAMGKDASMRARRDLLDLKKNYLKAKRREDTALKLIKAKEKKPKAKRTGGRGVSSSKGEEAVYRVLAALNDGYGLKGDDPEALRRAGLTPLEISRIDPEDRESWRVLTGKIRRNKTLKAQANAIMSGRSTPKDADKAEIRKLEGEAKRLREEAKATDNKVEKKRLEDRADAKDVKVAEARVKAAELLAEAARKRLASATQIKKDKDAGAPNAAEVTAARKEIAELQKDLNAVDVNIAAGGKSGDPEKWARMKIVLEAKIKALRGKLPATPDKKTEE